MLTNGHLVGTVCFLSLCCRLLLVLLVILFLLLAAVVGGSVLVLLCFEGVLHDVLQVLAVESKVFN